MKNLRQIFLGIIIALASIGLILGGFSLSLTEQKITANHTPAHSLTPTNSPTLQTFTPAVASLTPSPTLTLTFTLSLTSTWTSTLTSTWTPTLPPTSTKCPPPAGWFPYVVQAGDTLAKIATRYRVGVTELQQANCLLTIELLPGMVVYVPPLPTQTPLSCGRPAGWIVYIVQPNDTLYHLSLAFGVSVAQLQQANCLGNSTILHVGQSLYVPPWATRTPSPTFPAVVTPTTAPTDTPIVTPTDTPIVTPTDTPESSLPSETPTEAPTITPTEPPAPTASDTPVEVPSETLDPEGP